MSDLRGKSEILDSALHILDYGCDWGDYDAEAAAVRELISEHERLREAAETVARCHRSFRESLPFQPPEALYSLYREKLAHALVALDELVYPSDGGSE